MGGKLTTKSNIYIMDVRCRGTPEEKLYWVIETGRHINRFKVFYDDFESYEDARAYVRKLEQCEEFRWNESKWRHKMPKRGMTRYEKLVLLHLFEALQTDSNVFTFQGLAFDLGITERQAKTACRALKRRDFAVHEAYWSDDGLLGGSGYSITNRGCFEARKLVSEATQQTSGSPETAAPVPSPAE